MKRSYHQTKCTVSGMSTFEIARNRILSRCERPHSARYTYSRSRHRPDRRQVDYRCVATYPKLSFLLRRLTPLGLAFRASSRQGAHIFGSEVDERPYLSR